MIGMVVTWSNVPRGALVRGERSASWYVRVNDCGWCVYAPPHDEPNRWVGYAQWGDGSSDDSGWPWDPGGDASMRIAALGLTGDESAETLKGLAEAFEQRFPWEGA